MKRLIFILLLLPAILYAQEALKSIEEEYYDFLSLTGVTERPTLGYRTLSDNVWTFKDVETFEENEDGTFTKVRVPGEESDAHIWKNNNLGTTYTLWEASAPADNWFTRGIKQGFTARIYGPEWFNSYNTAAPYGQNDGALWQGRGYNTSLTAGVRLEGYGFELTFKPQVCWMENREFELMDNSSFYSNKYAYIWGYKNDKGVDAPQRFGDSSFWTFDWGDSEVRFSWGSFTLGFGTQSPWIGPSWFNPILHSNNAISYPKIDFGFRSTKIYLPFCNWYLGRIEGRIWMGYLTESDYFDANNFNNHNRINGFNFSYLPSFIPGLSLGLTKICMSKWDSFEIKYLNPFYDENGGIGTAIGEDQKVSFYIDYIFPKGSFELYSEIGLDDYLQGGWFEGISRYPFDTLIWTFGFKKNIIFSQSKNIWGNLIFEYSNMEQGRNKVSAKQAYAFNFHHQITQGYTNKGQYLGTALANGGNSQTLILNIFYKKGKTEFLIQRENPDDTYSYINLSNNNQTYKGFFTTKLSNTYFITSDFEITTGLLYQRIINSLYFDINNNSKVTSTCNNFCISFICKYIL